MPASTASRTRRMASSTVLRSPRWWPPSPSADTFTPVRPSGRCGISSARAMMADLSQSRIEQGQTCLRVDLTPNGLGVRGQHHFYGWADCGLEQVSAAGRAVPQAECDVDVEERL